MYIVNILLFVVVFTSATVESVSTEQKFVEELELTELQTVLDDRMRNILTEFHEVKPGDINFFLITRENSNFTLLNDTNLNLVNPKRLTNFIVGGWIQNFRQDAVYTDMGNAYLRKGDYNIIIVDDAKLSFFPAKVAMSYVQPIGIVVAKFVVKLQQHVNVSLNSVSIVGHSLGGNVAGFAGREVTRLTGAKIARIIGLDASHFPFHPVNKNDAQVVQLIHTTGVAGLMKPRGSIDFYPNGANYNLQPGCTLYPTKPLKSLTDAVNFVFCSHHKSYEYFILTINSTIKGVKCESYSSFQAGKCKNNELAIFGDNYVPGPEGSFYMYLNCNDTSCISSYS